MLAGAEVADRTHRVQPAAARRVRRHGSVLGRAIPRSFALEQFGEIEYAVLRASSTPGLPLIYLLHGGGGSRDFLGNMRGGIEAQWAKGTLPPAVIVTPSAERSFYMNYRDGTRMYEDHLVGDFLEHVRSEYVTATDREHTAIIGISMGGMGGLRLAFKHPEIFGAVAALEPGIEPVFEFDDIEPQDRFFRNDELFETIYGKPVDRAFWADNNPATIAQRDPRRLDDTQIFIECGDEDSLNLFRGTEFLHRVLYDNGVRHEYRLIRGADHLGRTLGPRFEAAYAFIGQALNPPGPDETLTHFHIQIRAIKKTFGL